MGNDHQTKLTSPESERRYAVGIKTTSCLATLTIRLYILLPSAWQVEMLTIEKPAIIKLMLIILKAGTPTEIISAEALKKPRRVSGRSWNAANPNSI